MSRPQRSCGVEGYAEKHAAKGLCGWHYGRVHSHGDVASLDGPRPVAFCVECGASLPRQDMKLCGGCRPVARPSFVNPLVCVCAEPAADPRVNFGMCSKCFRKPLALMGVPS